MKPLSRICWSDSRTTHTIHEGYGCCNGSIKKLHWQQFITTITNSEMIIGIIRGISSVISVVSDALGKVGFSGQVAMTSILAAAAALKVYTIYTKIAASTDGIYFAIKKALNIETLKSIANFIKVAASTTFAAISNIFFANTSVIATGAT